MIIAAALLGGTAQAQALPDLSLQQQGDANRTDVASVDRMRVDGRLTTRIHHSKIVLPGQEPEVKCESAGDGGASNTTSSSQAQKISVDDLASWRDAKLTLTVDGSFPKSPSALAALQSAVDAWTSSVSELPAVELRIADDNLREPDGEIGRSDHRIYFAQFGDSRTQGALAVTVTTVGTDHAQILDGDIIVDGRYPYHGLANGDDGLPLWYDLQSVLTHELGHWFGLPEDYCHRDATMYAYTWPGETTKRDLAPSDVIEAQVAYWRADNPSGQVGCHVRPNGSSSEADLVGCVMALALLACSRRSGASRRTSVVTGDRR